MKTATRSPLFGVLVAFAILFAASPALAYTEAGDTVSNQASLTYEVGGIGQDPVLSDNDADPNNGIGTTDFVVDRLVRPIVTLQTAPDPFTVTPGASAQELVFQVANDGNDPLGSTATFQLSVVTGTDDIGPTPVVYEVDTDNDGTYDVTAIALGTAQDVTIPSEGFVTVRILGDIPLAALDGEQSVYDLVAQAYDDAGTTLLDATDNAAADTAGEDIVLADAAGSAAGDVANDAKHSARGTFEIASASLAVQKTEAVTDDGLGGTFHIPGATVLYTITIDNNGTTDATNVVLTDTAPPNTTYVAGSLQITAGAGSVDDTGGNLTATFPTIAAGTSATVTFEVTID